MRDDLNRKISYCGILFEPLMRPLDREFYFIQKGGTWKKSNGDMAGKGLAFHFKNAMQILWPWIKWHRWLEMYVEAYLTHRSIAVLGPSSTGKSFGAAATLLCDYYCFPTSTTGIVCSDTLENLQNRIWGEIKMLHKDARARHEDLPGHLIEGRNRIVTDDQDAITEGRDFRNGLVGLPVKNRRGDVQLASFVGFKNKRVRLIGDELQFLSPSFVTSISNLDKNPDFKMVGMGNPKETTDALGVLAEPAYTIGGWDGGIDQQGKSKAWETRRPQGCCLQFVGSDSPNLDGKFGCDLITQEAMDRDEAFFGKNSLQFTMMNEGRMPRGQGSRRIITRQECLKHRAMEEPIWLNRNVTKILFLDAAYGGVGGDRCIMGELDFGEETGPLNPTSIEGKFVNQPKSPNEKKQIIALVDTVLVPIDNSRIQEESAPDQIAIFVKAEAERRGIPPQNFIFDSGMRTALVQSIMRIWSSAVHAIDCGGSPTDRKVWGEENVICKDHYQKFVTELWYSVRYAIIAGQWRGMTDDVMLEFGAREWGMVGKNKIEIESKKEFKRKQGYSPDKADAVAIGLELARRKGFIIQSLRSGRDDDNAPDERWKQDMREKARKHWQSGQLTEEAA
jgi:hypothetical protein